ncbi:MAG TPA: hypothetical protein VGM78_10070 [Ilumatobacteraceae bacterium]
MSDHLDCAAFDDALAELALELLDANERDRLMAHAATCERCRAELESMSTVADRMVLLAPECEVPLGFEQRAIDAMGPARSSRRTWLVGMAAALVLLVGVAGVVIGRSTSSDAPRRSVGQEAALVDAHGAVHGSVLISNPGELLLTMTLSKLDQGTYHCWVTRADGTTTEVAAWPVDASGRGAWVVPLDPSLPTVRAVEVTEDGGSTIATASLS